MNNSNKDRDIQLSMNFQITKITNKIEIYVLDTKNGLLYLPQINLLVQINDPKKVDTLLKKYKKRHIFITPEEASISLGEGLLEIYYKNLKTEFSRLFALANPKKILLHSVFLLVSQMCNLRCVYCYGNQGRYEYKDSYDELMSIEIAKRFIDVFINSGKFVWNKKPKITFFGGEPLLNLKIIEYIAREITSISDSFQFSIVTNGTILTKKAIELIKKYKMQVTVSLDGPKEINDKLRIFPNGRGSYDIIVKNLEKLRNEGINFAIEATVTSLFPDPSKIYEDLKKHKPSTIILTPVRESKNNPLVIKDSDEYTSKYLDFLSKSLKTFIKSAKTLPLGFLYSLIRLHSNYLPDYPCDLGIHKLAISSNGDVYPCHMLVGLSEYKMGNINYENFPDDKFYSMRYNFMKRFSTAFIPMCKNCWNRYLCNRCFASEIKYNIQPSCEMSKQMSEYFLKTYFMIYNNPEIRQRLNELISAIKVNP